MRGSKLIILTFNKSSQKPRKMRGFTIMTESNNTAECVDASRRRHHCQPMQCRSGRMPEACTIPTLTKTTASHGKVLRPAYRLSRSQRPHHLPVRGFGANYFASLNSPVSLRRLPRAQSHIEDETSISMAKPSPHPDNFALRAPCALPNQLQKTRKDAEAHEASIINLTTAPAR